MNKYDITILTDSRYVNPGKITTYVQNILDEDNLVIQALIERGFALSGLTGRTRTTTGPPRNLPFSGPPGITSIGLMIL